MNNNDDILLFLLRELVAREEPGRIPAIPFSNLLPTRNVGVSAFVAGGTRDRVVETAVQGAKALRALQRPGERTKVR